MRSKKYPHNSFFDLIYYYQPPRTSWGREMMPLFRKVQKTKDDRSFILSAALVIENRIDSMLKIIIPGYDRLLKNNDLTFALKIDIGRSLRLIPDKLFDMADFFRVVRNDFAHNLKYDSLKKMKENRKDRMIQLASNSALLKKSHDTRKLMDDLYFVCAAEFRLQQMNVELFYRTVRKKEFRALLEKEYHNYQRIKETPRHKQPVTPANQALKLTE
jgi:hypothetical protein